MFYANIYIVDQAFGGPEEGGWWFTYGSPVERLSRLCRAFSTEEEAYAYRASLAGKIEELNEGRHELSSVLCEGVFAVYVEEHPAKAFPEVRPHYE